MHLIYIHPLFFEVVFKIEEIVDGFNGGYFSKTYISLSRNKLLIGFDQRSQIIILYP